MIPLADTDQSRQPQVTVPITASPLLKQLICSPRHTAFGVCRRQPTNHLLPVIIPMEGIPACLCASVSSRSRPTSSRLGLALGEVLAARTVTRLALTGLATPRPCVFFTLAGMGST